MKRHILYIVTVSLCLLSVCGSPSTANIDVGESLTIKTDTLTTEPSFVDWAQDGQKMQLIALKNEDGEV